MNLSDEHDRSEVIKIFHLVFYSIEFNLLNIYFGIKREAEQ